MNTNGYKETIVGTIPTHWELVPLGTVAETHDRLRVPLSETERQNIRGKYPYYGANGLIDHIDKFILDGEYVLLAEDGGYWGKGESSSYVVNGKFWVNNHAHILKSIDGKTINTFLSFILNHVNIDPFITGDARGKLTQAVMKQLPIPLPPLPEQRRIAAILSKIQHAIEVQKKIIERINELKKALMAMVFPPGGEIQNGERYENSILDDQYSFVRFEDVLLGGTQNGLYKSRSYYGTGYPIADMGDLFRSDIMSGQKERVQLTDDELTKYCLHESDLIFARRSFKPSGSGKCQLVLKLTEPTVFSSSIIRVSLNQEKVVPLYALYFFTSPSGLSIVSRIIRRLAVSGISGSDLRQIPFPLIGKKSQERIAESLGVCDQAVGIKQEKVRVLVTLFRSMLHQLMTGQISVSNIEIPFDA